MRILYVEDNLANLALVQRLARIGNHEVISHPDGESTLAYFDHDRPDLVLMDVQLKGALNGLEVVRTLRERGHKTPIIALTAYAMVGDRERCLEAGCDDYLPKPLPVEQLVEFFQQYDSKNAGAPPSQAAATGDSQLPESHGADGKRTVSIPSIENAPVPTAVGNASPPALTATPEPEATANVNQPSAEVKLEPPDRMITASTNAENASPTAPGKPTEALNAASPEQPSSVESNSPPD